MRDERRLQSTSAAISRQEAVASSIPAPHRTVVYPRPKVILQVAVVVQIEVLEQVADPRLLPI